MKYEHKEETHSTFFFFLNLLTEACITLMPSSSVFKLFWKGKGDPFKMNANCM